MGRRSLLLIAAALCAALGTVLVWLYVQGADTRAAAGADLVEVEVTTGDVPADTPAEAVSVRAARVPRDLASGAVTRRQVAGQRTAAPITGGQVLRAGMFTAGAVSGVSDGLQAVALTITGPAQVPALLKPGDDVAVYTSPRAGGAPVLVLPHARVQTVGSRAGSSGQVPATIVGFELKPPDALQIVKVQSSGDAPILAINGKGAEPIRPG